VDGSVRQFCASARARFQACTDFDAQRQYLVDHIERVIFNRYKVTVTGSVPVHSASGETKLPFRIEGEIAPKAVRSGIYSRGGVHRPPTYIPHSGDHTTSAETRDARG
jgi:hypothetical protein